MIVRSVVSGNGELALCSKTTVNIVLYFSDGMLLVILHALKMHL